MDRISYVRWKDVEYFRRRSKYTIIYVHCVSWERIKTGFQSEQKPFRRSMIVEKDAILNFLDYLIQIIQEYQFRETVWIITWMNDQQTSQRWQTFLSTHKKTNKTTTERIHHCWAFCFFQKWTTKKGKSPEEFSLFCSWILLFLKLVGA